MSHLFVTGATGFLGRTALPILARRFDRVTALTRSSSAGEGASISPNVRFVRGDLLKPGILESITDLERDQPITAILHMAAYYDLQGDASSAYLSNVVGTQNLLDFASSLVELQWLHAISTIAVAGDFRGRFTERTFNVGQAFPNPYAATKFRAEDLVVHSRLPVPRRIYRLGILVGDSRTGAIPKVDGPYYFLRLLEKGRAYRKLLSRTGLVPLPLPYRPEAKLYLLPVDVAADLLSAMVSEPVQPEEKVRAYHLVGKPVSTQSFIDSALREAGLRMQPVPLPRRFFPEPLLKALGIPPETVHYMLSGTEFDCSQLEADYPALRMPPFDEYRTAMLKLLRDEEASA
jgi:thioester reductase-like protein